MTESRARPAAYTTGQIMRAVAALEGVQVPRRTVADLPRMGLVVPSVRWDRIRGRAHPCLWSRDDLLMVRLIVRLRRAGGLSMLRVRALLRLCGPELRAALQSNSRTELVVDRRIGVVLRRVDSIAEVDVSADRWQFRLPLAALHDGVDRVTAEVLKAAA